MLAFLELSGFVGEYPDSSGVVEVMMQAVAPLHIVSLDAVHTFSL